MLWREKIGYVILFLIIFTFIINLGPINNFLGSHTDKTISLGMTGLKIISVLNQKPGWNPWKMEDIKL